MESRKSIEKRNFGLNSISRKNDEVEFDNWFWESKSKKKVKEQEKQAQIERMRAETAAMQQILADQNNSQDGGMGVGKITLIGGLVVLLGIGAVVIMKKKSTKPEIASSISTNDIIA